MLLGRVDLGLDGLGLVGHGGVLGGLVLRAVRDDLVRRLVGGVWVVGGLGRRLVGSLALVLAVDVRVRLVGLGLGDRLLGRLLDVLGDLGTPVRHVLEGVVLDGLGVGVLGDRLLDRLRLAAPEETALLLLRRAPRRPSAEAASSSTACSSSSELVMCHGLSSDSVSGVSSCSVSTTLSASTFLRRPKKPRFFSTTCSSAGSASYENSWLGLRDDAPALVLHDVRLVGVLRRVRLRRPLDLVLVLGGSLRDSRLAAAEEAPALLLDRLGLDIGLAPRRPRTRPRRPRKRRPTRRRRRRCSTFDELDRALDLVGRQRDLGPLRDLGGAPGGLVRRRKVRVGRALHVQVRARSGPGVRAVDEAVFPEGHGS